MVEQQLCEFDLESGLGRMAVNAVADRDLPLVQAITLIFGLIYVGMTLTADLLAMALNPRLRTRRL